MIMMKMSLKMVWSAASSEVSELRYNLAVSMKPDGGGECGEGS